MFNNKFKFDAAADLAKSILEADTKAKMEALKGDQEKLDKNRNGKLDAHDFKILRGEKKVNEAEADYQSSYRVGKTANFKPKASDVGQGRKITGKMGKYGKQPDDDNMVEPPPEHKVGDVKTDPSAVVPGHSTMGAKLHLASLPKDAEGNTIHKGARRVNAADLVAKRKAMMAGQKNEEYEQLDEIGDTPAGKAALQSYRNKAHDQLDKHEVEVRNKSYLPSDKKMANRASSARKAGQRLFGFHKYGGPNKGYGAGPGPKNEEYVEEGIEDTLHPAGAALLKHIKPQHHNLYKPHLTKDVFNGSYGDRTSVLKAAKDAGHLKMDLKKQNEEVEELDELSKSTLGSYVKKAIRDKSDVAYEKGYWDRADHKDKPEKRLVRDKISDRKSWRDAGIKKAINRLTKEDVESITEGKMDKMTLSGLWHRHAQHSYMSDQGYGHGEGGMKNNEHAATAIENHVRKHYGNKVADDMVSHSDHHVSHAEYAGPESSSHHEKEADKLRKKHGIHGDLYGESVEHVNERTLTSGETSEKERIVHGMKKSLKGFKARYGDRAKEVIYATATKQAKKD